MPSGHRPITFCNGVSANLAFDQLSPSAKAVAANVIELPGDGECRPFISGRAWRTCAGSTEREIRSSSSKGAKRGANVGSYQATSGDNQPWFVQLDGPSGHLQQRAATGRMRLKAEGRRFDPAPDHQFCSVIRSFGPLRGAKAAAPTTG